MGKKSRDKGRRWEWEVRDMARGLHPTFAGVQRGIGQARGAGEVADVDTPFLWLEAKHYAVVTDGDRLAALAQAQRAELESRAKHGRARIPVAVCKADRRQPTATLMAKDYAAIAFPSAPVGLAHDHPIHIALPDFLRAARYYVFRMLDTRKRRVPK